MCGIQAKKPFVKRIRRGFSLVELVAGFSLITLMVLGLAQYTLVSHLNMVMASTQQSLQELLADTLLEYHHLEPGASLRITLPEKYQACTPEDRRYILVEKSAQPTQNTYLLRAAVWWQWLPGDNQRCQLLEMRLHVPE